MKYGWLIIIAVSAILACSKPVPYSATKAYLETEMQNREIKPAGKGCDLCHGVLAVRFSQPYYPVPMSHAVHSRIGIGCAFCHRKALSSTEMKDSVLPEGHGFTNNKNEDRNPCKACHLYFSKTGIKDKKIPSECKTCHPGYEEQKPLMPRWMKYNAKLKNNHKIHFEKGIPCLRCHPGFYKMEGIVPNFIPKMDICYECHGATEAKSTEVPAIDPAGKLFNENCSMCHGADGRGNGPVSEYFSAGLKPRNLTDNSYMSKRSDQEIHDVISMGGPELMLSERMPAFKNLLTEEEIDLLTGYVRRLSKNM